jgi:hypothetical protein
MATKTKTAPRAEKEDLNHFPKHPRPNGNIVNVFWVVSNDYRALTEAERRNVIYPAKAAGLMNKAPRNERGVPVNKVGKTSACRFVLTGKGEKYYASAIEPLIPKGFISETACPKVRRTSTDVSISDLKKLERLGQV